MKFAIVGTGALGGFYGGLLAKHGEDVHFLLHSDVAFVKEHGLRVDSKLGDFHISNVQAYGDASEMPKCDCIVVAIKSTQNQILEKILPPLMHPESVVLVLQNGLHVEQKAREVAGEGRVIGGCCFLCSNKVGPGHIKHLDYGRIVMGPYKGINDDESSPDKEVVSDIARRIRQTGIDCTTTDDLSVARWRKLMWNIPFNGLSVVLNASTDAIMRHPYARELAQALMQEVRLTANACGHNIEPEFVTYLMENTDDMVPYDSSMRLDFLAGRPIEVESIYGNAIRAAARKQINAPLIHALYRQLHFLADKRVSSEPLQP